MKSRPNITDEEVRSYMNFEALVREHKNHRTNANRWLQRTITLVGIGSLALFVYMAWPKNTATSSTSEVPVDTPITTDSVVTKEPIAEKQMPAVEPSRKNEKSEKAIVKKEPITEKPTTEESQEQTVPKTDYVQAEPLNGFPDLYNYFSRELQYPIDAIKDSIQGIVSVSFIINISGQPEQIRIQNSLGAMFDKEAERLIKNMPDWKPAALNGKSVPAKLSMPITFKVATKQK